MIGETASDDTTCDQGAFISGAFDYINQSVADSARPDINGLIYFNIRKQENGSNGRPHDLQWAIGAPESQPVVPSAPVAPTTPAPTSAIGALLLSAIQQGNFSFNGGTAREANGVYAFTADHARDPGFGVLTGGHRLEGRNTLRFEIRGNFQQLGGYARFIAQVYRDSDNPATPTVSLDPVDVSADWAAVTVGLNHEIRELQKVQFLLVTDQGSCQIEIRNIRFE
jgi:hypothetical protein